MNLSGHISEKEAVHSATASRLGLSNKPDGFTWETMKITAEKVFEPIRNHFGVPIGISSFYRSPELNKKIGGSKSSQHCLGKAIDIDGDIFGGVDNLDIFRYIKDNLEFDQLIWEFQNEDGTPQWIHISYNEGNNRGEILRSSKNEKGKTIYLKYGGSVKVKDLQGLKIGVQ